MKKMPVKFLVAFIAIIGLLIVTTVSGVVANPAITSENYDSHFEMNHIGITLTENDKIVGFRNYYTEGDKGNATDYGWKTGSEELFKDITNFKVGETYSEEFRVHNSGTIDEYVRVIIYKYWVSDAEGLKNRKLNPDFIELGLNTGGNWILDESATTKERVILYYKVPLKVEDKFTEPFMNTLTISNHVLDNLSAKETEVVKGDTKYKTVVYTYEYDGYKFCVEMEADAVQTHNAKDAIKSAWGRDVTIGEDKTLKLN